MTYRVYITVGEPYISNYLHYWTAAGIFYQLTSNHEGEEMSICPGK